MSSLVTSTPPAPADTSETAVVRRIQSKYQTPPAIQTICLALSSDRVWRLVSPWLYLALLFWFGQHWLQAGLPTGDLGGAVADLERWQHFWQTGQIGSAWDSTSFLGHPRTLFNLYSGMAAAYAPFLLFFPPLIAVKIGMLTYLGLAGWTLMRLVHQVTHCRPAALLMGAAYALHPIHLSLSIASSHANFPPFYFLLPLLLAAILRLVDQSSARRIAWVALLAALAGWVDLERLAVCLPALALLVTAHLCFQPAAPLTELTPPRRSFWRTLGVLGLAGLLAVGLLTVLWLPILADHALYAWFSEQTRQSSVDFFSIRNPLYYIDHAGRWFASLYTFLPPEQNHDAGNFYLGLPLLVLAGTGLMIRREYVSQPVLLGGAVVCVALLLASAQGTYGGATSLDDICDQIFLHTSASQAAGLTLSAALTFPVIIALLLVFLLPTILRRSVSRWGLPIAAAAFIIVFWAKPYAWVWRFIPPFNSMRNPGWFATVVPAFLALAAGIGLAALLRVPFNRVIRVLIILIAVLSIGWDIGTYRASFDHVAPATATDELATIGSYLSADPRDGAVLTRESYNPQADILYAYAHRRAAWYWLNWMATPQTSDLVLKDIYGQLHRPNTIEQALTLAGQANIRFILYDLTEGPPPPRTTRLRPIWSGHAYALYENLLCQPAVRLEPSTFDAVAGNTSPDAPVGHTSTVAADTAPDSVHTVDISPAEDIRHYRIHSDSPQRLVVSTSWTPRWQALVDGHSVPVHRVHEAMIGIDVPAGTCDVILRYPTHWSTSVACGISGLAGLGLLVLSGFPLLIARLRRRQTRD